jgi:DNA-binding transcriptional regulator LsrR (DeoR family)
MKKRAHKGRPKKAAKMKRIVKPISLYAGQQKKLTALAKRLGMSESEVVRMLIENWDR